MVSKVSVIVPVYNVEAYLEQCIHSILQQSYKNIELILVNDGSTDKSLEIIQKFQKNYSEIVVVNQKNQGLSGARNSGINIAKGEYIIFVDSDDYIDKELVEDAVKRTEETNSDITVFGYKRVQEDGTLIKEVKLKENILSVNEALSQILSLKISPMACNKLYKRALFLDNNIRYPLNKLHEDLGTTYKLIWHTKRVAILPKSYYNWVVRDGSITSNTTYRHVNDIYDLFYQQKYFLKENSIYRNFREYYEVGFMKMLTLILERLTNQKDKESLIALQYHCMRVREESEEWESKDQIYYQNLTRSVNTLLKAETPMILKFKKRVQSSQSKIRDSLLPYNSRRRKLVKKLIKG